MRQIFATLMILFAQNILAQTELPKDYSFSIGIGIAAPDVNTPAGDFTGPGYCALSLRGEGRYFLSQRWAVGARYDYVHAPKKVDWITSHNIQPVLTYFLPVKKEKSAVSFSLGAGYMNYQEDNKTIDGLDYPVLYKKDFLSVSLGAAFEFAICKNLSGQIRFDVNTADWKFNKDGRFMDCDATICNLGIGLQFGK